MLGVCELAAAKARCTAFVRSVTNFICVLTGVQLECSTELLPGVFDGEAFHGVTCEKI